MTKGPGPMLQNMWVPKFYFSYVALEHIIAAYNQIEQNWSFSYRSVLTQASKLYSLWGNQASLLLKVLLLLFCYLLLATLCHCIFTVSFDREFILYCIGIPHIKCIRILQHLLFTHTFKITYTRVTYKCWLDDFFGIWTCICQFNYVKVSQITYLVTWRFSALR